MLRRISLLTLAVATAGTVHADLRHHYSFNDGTANDSVGTAHGTLFGGATVSGGSVVLPGGPPNTPDTSANNAGPYVDLNGPAIAVNSYSALTLELWLKSDPINATPNQQWIYAASLGRHTTNMNGEAAFAGFDYVSMQPTRAIETAQARSEINTTGGVAGVTLPFTVADGLLHQMVTTIGGGNISLYFDGQLLGAAPLGGAALNLLSNEKAYLGRSIWTDPFFTGSIDEFRIYDNALTATEVANRFSVGPAGSGSPGGTPILTIDRSAGTMTLTKSGSPYSVVGYSVASPSGAFDATKWNPIANNGDADNGGTFDATDSWTVVSNTSRLLSENDPVDGSADDGGVLGAGGTTSRAILSSNGWIKSYREDVSMTLRLLSGGTEVTSPVIVQYTGNGGAAYRRSDLNFDNLINAADYNIFKSFHLTTLNEVDPAKSYAKGDIDGLLDNNGVLQNNAADFRLFKADYIAANGPGGWEALFAVPEPGAIALAAGGAAAAWVRRRRRLSAAATGRSAPSPALGWAGLAAVAMGVLGARSATAQSSVTLEFNAAGGTVLDSAGVGTGFTTRLPGTGTALPANDPNLTLNTGAGVLNVQTQQADYNGGAGLTTHSAPGISLASLGFTGAQDFRVTAMFGPLTGHQHIDQAGIFIGTGTTAMTRAGMIDFSGGSEYFAGHTTGTTDNNGRFFGFGLNVADGMSVEIRRVDGIWTYLVDGVDWTPAQQPNGQAGSPNLNLATDLVVGPYAITPLNTTVKTWALQSFTAEILPIPETVVLEIVQATGAMQLRNVTAAPITFDQYSVSSSLAAFLPANGAWNSLSDQNYDAIGVQDGQSWDEIGAASTSRLAELFLRGATTLDPGESVSLGAGYNSTVAAVDLRFEYSTTTGGGGRSAVKFVSGLVDANFNNDPLVDGADVLILQRNLGRASGATNAQGDSNGDGAVNAADFANFASRFGQGQATAAAVAAPEPGSLWSAVAAMVLAPSVRRRAGVRSLVAAG